MAQSQMGDCFTDWTVSLTGFSHRLHCHIDPNWQIQIGRFKIIYHHHMVILICLHGVTYFWWWYFL